MKGIRSNELNIKMKVEMEVCADSYIPSRDRVGGRGFLIIWKSTAWDFRLCQFHQFGTRNIVDKEVQEYKAQTGTLSSLEKS